MMKKKILFILPFFPYPLTSGGHQAIYNGILAVKDDYDLYISYPAYNTIEQEKAEKEFLTSIPNSHLLPFYKKVQSLYVRALNKIKRIIKAKLLQKRESDNAIIEKNCRKWIKDVCPLDREWSEHIEAICDRNNFSIIQVEMPMLLSQILSLPSDVKTIYVHHELGFVRRALESKTMPSSAYANACCAYADVNEINLLNKYNMVMTLSPVDAQKLEERGLVVPVRSSFAKTDLDISEEGIVSDGKHLVFIGSPTHLPNFIGIKWFLENCWLLLKQKDPDYHLALVGIWPDTSKIEIKKRYPEVQFMGYVHILSDAVQNSIMIVPITIGSGIRMKILDACAIGLPFVSTSVGAEGLPVKNGEHCFIADDPHDFVESIIKLQDQNLQKMFAQNEKNMMNNCFSLEALRENRLSIYDELLRSY